MRKEVRRRARKGNAGVRRGAPGSATGSRGVTATRSGSPWRALVAEDNIVSQRVAAGHMRRLGGEVDVVSNGRDAVQAVVARRYDIVLMDLRMPEMDGLDATREIRRREGSGPRTPIVAVTANAYANDRGRCLAAGMDDYFAKPIHSEDLRRAVNRYVFGVRDGSEEPSEPRRPTDGLPVVDDEALERLRTLDPDGTAGFLTALARDFDQGFHERLDEMRAALRTGDAALLESAAHNLKGSAGLLGALALAERCRQLEQLAGRGAVAEGSSLVAGLAPEHRRVMKVIDAAASSPVSTLAVEPLRTTSPDRRVPA